MGKKYNCHECDKEFSTKYIMIRHIQSAHEGIKFPCSICDLKLCNKQKLIQHLKKIHNSELWKENKTSEEDQGIFEH